MGMLNNAMCEHLAQCAAAGYNASPAAWCPFIPPSANDAWQIGRFLYAQGLPLPRHVSAAGAGRYSVDGTLMQVATSGVQLLQ